MKGRVDDKLRALLSVEIQSDTKSDAESIEAWVDTAFDGHFVFSSTLIEKLELESLVETEAILADGTKVVLETYIGYVHWFGKLVPVQVVNNEGRFPLLGTGLLEECRLMIDYLDRTVEVVLKSEG